MLSCTYTSHYGNQSAATTQILANVNSASALYQSTFNVSLGVVELNVQDANCPSSASAATCVVAHVGRANRAVRGTSAARARDRPASTSTRGCRSSRNGAATRAAAMAPACGIS